MYKLFSILLSALVLIQSFNIEADDLMQLDELVEHAQFHKQQYGDTFFDFLSKHYGELKAEHSKNHQEEQSEHEQLPFQCQGHSSTFIAFLQFNSTNHSSGFEVLNSSETNFIYLNLYASLHDEELLQPPRHA